MTVIAYTNYAYDCIQVTRLQPYTKGRPNYIDIWMYNHHNGLACIISPGKTGPM